MVASSVTLIDSPEDVVTEAIEILQAALEAAESEIDRGKIEETLRSLKFEARRNAPAWC